MPTPIVPTVGRKVWFYKNAQQVEPIDATVIKVHAPDSEATPHTAVNLATFDPDTGDLGFVQSVAFHERTDPPFQNPHYSWMPYQAKQADKAATETKTYTDGTSATGPGSLPNQSPAQQDAAVEADQLP